MTEQPFPSVRKSIFKKRSQGPEIWRRFKKNKRAVVGLCIIILYVFIAAAAPVVAPYNPAKQNYRERLQTPTAAH